MEIKEFNNTQLLSLSSITSISNFTINPYKGCSFGCKYCYAALNKNIKKSGEWGSFVVVKKNIYPLLENEIKSVLLPDLKDNLLDENKQKKITNNNINNSISRKQFRIIIGSNTDPYQPIELKYRSTNKILSILNKFNIGVFLMTKSPLIINDLHLLSKIKNLEICFTINSSNIIKNLEHSLDLDKRIKTIFSLFQSDVNIYIHIGPFIPYFTQLVEIKNHFVKYFKNCKKKIKINIEPLNLVNANSKFLKILKNIDYVNFYKLIKIYSDKDKYYKFYNSLQKVANCTFNFPFVKRVKLLKRDFNNYYSQDINVQ